MASSLISRFRPTPGSRKHDQRNQPLGRRPEHHGVGGGLRRRRRAGDLAVADVCLVTAVPYTVFLVAGIGLVVVGVPMLVLAARAATFAYNSDKLATTGIFGLTRNPIYSAWIVFIIPGLVLMSRSWPLFLTPVVAYLIFKARIGRENEYLEKRFGEEYRKYKAQVNELIPFPRRK